jgi:hypothetical protein
LILTIFTIIISIWPWWVYALPLARQTSRLENNLKIAWILKNWEIVPLKNYEDISSNLSTEIYSEISYVCDFNQCNNLKKLFPKQYEEVLKKYDAEQIKNKIEKTRYNNISSWEIVAWITEKIKVKWYYDNLDDSKRETLYFYISWKNNMFPLDVKWYSKVLYIWNNSDKTGSYWNINFWSGKLDIFENWKIVETIETKIITDKLYDIYKKNNKLDLDKSDVTFEIKNYKIIFESINIKNPEYKWESTNIGYYASGYILVR